MSRFAPSALRSAPVFGLFLCLFGLSACGGSDASEAPRPNVILVSLDTTRADHCSVYGYEKPTTPNLQRMADEGAIFEVAYAPASITGPTHSTLFTSLYPLDHGVVNNGTRLDDQFTTLAEAFAEDGYETGAIIASFVLAQKFGYAQGFRHYDDQFDPETSKVKRKVWAGNKIEEGFDKRGEEVVERALEWITKEREMEAPFFLFLHFFDPHSPYEPAEPFLSDFAPQGPNPKGMDKRIGKYDGAIAYTDAQLGVLLDGLRERGLDEDTLIVVVGDHGEALGQHNHLEHGASVYDEEVRVPLIMRWPAGIPAAIRTDTPVEVLDIAPTLYDLTGVPAPPVRLKGLSLAPFLRGEGQDFDDAAPIFLYRRDYSGGELKGIAGEAYGLRRGEWKLVYGPDEDRLELFNLDDDPRELNNLADEHPEFTEKLRAQLVEWIETSEPIRADAEGLSDADRDALRRLGYTD